MVALGKAGTSVPVGRGTQCIGTGCGESSADWKSAIQQVGNLRYRFTVRWDSPFYTSQICTPCFSEAIGSGLFGTNSCATKPLNPVSMIALITAG